ncbi:MAG: adenylate/guanylate cyclase domain-containing protein [Ilumatobacteraceae bacterium]
MSCAEVKVAVGIVGRIPQRALLSRWLAGALDGQPVVVVLDGPPGVGKSTLIDWLIVQASEHGAVHRVVVVPERGDVAEDLRRCIADTDELMRRGSPQLVIIDDAHWLDDAGQHLVEHLAFRLGTAAATTRPAGVCLVLVMRDEPPTRLISRLVDEPITRRISLEVLDDREARELAARLSPGIADRRTIARLVELSGGNPLTLNALADSIAVGEVLPPPASTTGTIPVEVAWRARLSTLSPEALRTAVMIALAERGLERGSDSLDLLAGAEAAIDELQSIGAVRRQAQGAVFTHPLLRTTALDLAPPELIVEVAGELLDRLDGGVAGRVAAGTLVRLSDAARRTGGDHHRDLVRFAYDEATAHGSWSAAGDLAENLLQTAPDDTGRAYWMDRIGKARFNELDRDEATERLMQAADLYAACAQEAAAETATAYLNSRAECLLLALRTDFTRGGPRRHPELDELVAILIEDESIDRHWRARSAAILAEVSWSTPNHDRRRQHVEMAQALVEGVDEPLTQFLVHFATGWHRLARLDLDAAAQSFTLAHDASRTNADPWWIGGAQARRALVSLLVGDPMVAISDATAAADASARASNWAEHGAALAVRSVAATRLGRFADADNDTESTILSARRADSGDPYLEFLPTAIWRRAVRGDEAGVAALREMARQQQMYMPFAEFIAMSLLRDVETADAEVRLRWSLPRNGLGFRNIGFHSAQFEAAILAGNLEVVDGLFALFDGVYQAGVRSSQDWPTSVALSMAAAAIELGDDSADAWLTRAEESAVSAGSYFEHALVDVYRSRHAFAAGRGDQAALDQGRAALEALDGLGAPLLARLQRDRLTSVVGQLGMSSGRERTVMFTDIVDSTRLMSSAGNAAWAVILGEHHRLVRSVVGRYRGSIMTSTGDGFSAWFGHPDDAVAAAQTLHQAIEHAALVVPGGSVKVRIGLASGSVFDLGSDVSGMAVAEAARVMSTAGAGETHLSQSVIEHGLDLPSARSIGLHSLKGLPKPVEIFVLAPLDAL